MISALRLLPLLLLALPTAAQQPPPDAARWVETVLDTLSLEQQVSQLFAPALYGYFKGADDPAYVEAVRLVEDFGAGGVIFFQGEPMDQAVFVNGLQRRAALPLLVSQDMEWGAGMRVGHTTTLPRTMAFGAIGDEQRAYRAGFITGTEARALGTHQIYAPIADVNNNPLNPIINVRAYGENPALVGRMVTAFVRGAQDAGVLATVKHFPGHGDTAVDSHQDLPVIAHSKARLDTLELVPFRQAFAGGARSVMTGHLAFPALEPDVTVPATLSPAIMTGLLRDEMGFDGLVVSDAMTMEGVRKHFGVGEAAVRAVEAGVDMILMSPDPYAARTAILAAIASGRLTPQRIRASVRRILEAKAWAGLHRERLVSLDDAPLRVATTDHLAFARGVARDALTLLRNQNDLLPFAPAPDSLVVVVLADSDDPATGRPFVRALTALAAPARVTPLFLGSQASEADYARATVLARRAPAVVVPTFLYVRAWSGQIGLSPRHKAWLDSLFATHPASVGVSFGNPYAFMDIAEPTAYVAAYGSDEHTQRAAAQGLVGAAPFSGTLPVTIPGRYRVGAGILLPQITLYHGLPQEASLDGNLPRQVDSLMQASIRQRAFPGAAVAIGQGQTLGLLEGYGYHTYSSDRRVTPQSLFDLASLTKVVATTTAAMLLYDRGQLDLDAPLARYLPAFAQGGKAGLTVRQIMTHTAGLRPFRPFHTEGFTTRDQVISAIMADTLVYRPGTDTRYSDFGIISLGLAIEAITGESLDGFVEREVFEPLGMKNTGFRKAGAGSDETVVPTEVDNLWRKKLVQGEVHDEAAFLLGGTAGHAGLFSTAEDLARFATMLVNEGRVGRRQLIQPETVRLFTRRADASGTSTRALGWDTRSVEGYSSAGTLFGPRSYGHTGFTGTSLWIDPDKKLYVILLTNRVYPTRDNPRLGPVRAALADLAFRALRLPLREAPAR